MILMGVNRFKGMAFEQRSARSSTQLSNKINVGREYSHSNERGLEVTANEKRFEELAIRMTIKDRCVHFVSAFSEAG